MGKARKEAELKMIAEIEDYLEMESGNYEASADYWGEFPEKRSILNEERKKV